MGMVKQANASKQQAAAEQPKPEEQEAYNAAVSMASEILHAKDESSQAITQMMTNADDASAPQIVADVTDLIIDQVEDAFGGELPESVIIPAADEISDLVIELGMESGAFQMDEAGATKAKGLVVQALMDTYGVEESALDGLLSGTTPEDVASYEQAFVGGAGGGTTA